MRYHPVGYCFSLAKIGQTAINRVSSIDTVPIRVSVVRLIGVDFSCNVAAVRSVVSLGRARVRPRG